MRSQDPDPKSLNHQLTGAELDLQGLEIGVFRQQRNVIATLAETFDRHFVIDTRNHNLTVASSPPDASSNPSGLNTTR